MHQAYKFTLSDMRARRVTMAENLKLMTTPKFGPKTTQL